MFEIILLLNIPYAFAYRHWLILTFKVCLMWIVNHPLNPYQNLSLSLRGGNWQKTMLES